MELLEFASEIRVWNSRQQEHQLASDETENLASLVQALISSKHLYGTGIYFAAEACKAP